MRRTLLVTLDYPPMRGGVANYYAQIVHLLPAANIYVLDNHHQELMASSRMIWPKWLKGLLSVAKYIREKNIEILAVGQLLPIGTIVWICSRIFHIPYIVFTHGMDVTIPLSGHDSRRKLWLAQHILHDAAIVTTSNNYLRQELLKQNLPPSKIVVLTPAPVITPALLQSHDVRAFLYKQHKLQHRKIILSVGRLVRRKGFDSVLECLPELVRLFPQLLYVIVGEGKDREYLEDLARDYGVTRNVLFVGSCDDATLAAWYDCCDIFVMVSRALPNHDIEGFGIVYLEANSFGKPVVGGLSGGVRDAIIDGQTGFLVEPKNPMMICKALTTLLQKPELAQRFGAVGRKRVEQNFQWHTTARELEMILSSLK